MVGDMPAPAMRQWRRWCRHPEFAWGAEPDRVCTSLEAAWFPVTAFSFTDDEAMTERCTQKLLAALRQAPSRLIRVGPGDVGLKRIGHLGAFKPGGTDRLWRLLAAAVDHAGFPADAPAISA
jgi:predicted alpha/beta hydrolase